MVFSFSDEEASSTLARGRGGSREKKTRDPHEAHYHRWYEILDKL